MKFIITGSGGRMGQSLIGILNKNNQQVVELNRKSDLSLISVKEKSVIIDFSSPDYFNKILNWSLENKIPFVSGTTGLYDEQFTDLAKASADIPVLWAPNMSMGVAFVNKLLTSFNELSEDFDFQVEEIHHRHKLDKPSGTGILLQDTLKSAVKKELPEVVSVRGGGVYGVHKIWAFSDEETISIEHQALNRDVFASGAIKCANWLINKGPGSYSINNVLGA